MYRITATSERNQDANYRFGKGLYVKREAGIKSVCEDVLYAFWVRL
jgi:hypothetical protein